ncbi:MAG: hypothetical protein AVDCRST_MAG93-5954 [uncultured Chloroflexia bacterium]|uniref:Putative zinc-finger domain-containing protein n=1 Tax=uncultured Chloroflexia bacterium TaxID=1672391 RepID=A0A6J4L8M7_9CHLR|nr:MAG: hypothetical protein AVDCRST_MAG93-5954 [uncultured Chloroflexia bacterium]
MTRCCDEGRLRAYIDQELPPAERDAVAAHLVECGTCRSGLERARTRKGQVGALLAPPATAPDPRRALARFQHEHVAPRTPAHERRLDNQVWRTTMETATRFWSGSRRRAMLGGAMAVVALSLLLFPPVRAVADQLLQVFRVQRVMFVPFDPERIKQLENLNLDDNTLFVAEPEIVNNPAPPRTVATADEAASAVDFALQQPADLPAPPSTTEFVVTDRTVAEFRVNVEGARQILSLMGVDDVTLPDALGTEPITADVAPSVKVSYENADYKLTLLQGTSPNVTLPDGVELAQLGKAALRLFGMDPARAESLSQSIDWSTTLVFPFPTGISNIRQVSVGDSEGMLVGGDEGDESHWQLYWQRGDRFFMLQGEGVQASDLLQIAESVR